MSISRRNTLKAAAGLLGASALPSVFAQAPYPDNVIRFVIPTPAGGGYDTMMRVIGEKLTAAWGQPVIVESKPGGSGAIAAATVGQAAPDGYTLMVSYSALLSNVVLRKNPGYQIGDFAPVGMLVMSPIAIGVNTSLGVETLQDLVDLARSKPRKLTYGSYGPGSGGHFVGEQFNLAADIAMTHVPYKGEAPALLDLLGGQIDAAVTSVGGVSRYPGRVKALAIVGDNRFPVYPDVPTFSEAGFPEVNLPGWGGLFAPARTPKPIIEKLHTEIARILKLPDVSAKLLELGFDPMGWGPEQSNKFLEEQLATITELVESGRVRI